MDPFSLNNQIDAIEAVSNDPFGVSSQIGAFGAPTPVVPMVPRASKETAPETTKSGNMRLPPKWSNFAKSRGWSSLSKIERSQVARDYAQTVVPQIARMYGTDVDQEVAEFASTVPEFNYKPTEFELRSMEAQKAGLDEEMAKTYVLTGKIASSEAPKPSEYTERAMAAKAFGLDPLSEEGQRFILTGKLKDNDNPNGITVTNPDGTVMQIGGKNASLPAEMGARIGLGKLFVNKDVPLIRQALDSENPPTGVYDYLQGRLGYGIPGEIQRRFASGVDALRRNLTGAGMATSEAADYANRYSPSLQDTAEVLRSKLDGLVADLEATAEGAIGGKTGNLQGLVNIGSRPNDVNNTSVYVDDLLKKYGE